MKKINTWLKLYSKLCRQPLKFIQNRKIVYKDGDKVIFLKLVFNENGTDWWLEEDTNDDEVMD